MNKPIAKRIHLTATQDAALKRRARMSGVPESTLLERGVRRALAEGEQEQGDPRAWARELRFIRRRARTTAEARPRAWTRDELYEERIDVSR